MLEVHECKHSKMRGPTCMVPSYPNLWRLFCPECGLLAIVRTDKVMETLEAIRDHKVTGVR